MFKLFKTNECIFLCVYCCHSLQNKNCLLHCAFSEIWNCVIPVHNYFQQVYMQFIFLQMLNIIVITIINSDQKMHLLYDATGCVCQGNTLLSQVVFFIFLVAVVFVWHVPGINFLEQLYFSWSSWIIYYLKKKICMFNYSNKFLESQILEAEPILSAAIEDDTRQE